MAKQRKYTIRQTIVAQTKRMRASAYAVSMQTRDAEGKLKVSPDHVKLYFDGKKDMTSERLDAIFEALGIKVYPAPPAE